MKLPRHVSLLFLGLLALSGYGCAPDLTPEQKQLVVELKQERDRFRQEIEQATKEDAALSGGLIKSLIGVRLEVLKTNAALVEQRIHALEGGARITVEVNAFETDPARAAELAKEIESQKAKIADARAEADRYSGGLVQALAETTVATASNTLAMLEQQYLMAKYGIALTASPSRNTFSMNNAETPSESISEAATLTAATARRPGPENCLEIETFDSSVLSTNDVFTELAWKVDVSNSCAEPFGARVTFTIYDKDEFELDSDSEEIYVPASGTGKARGKMLVSPPEKARRMARQGARLSLR